MSDNADEVKTLTREEILNSLIAHGVNSINSSYSYRSDGNNLMSSFVEMPLSEFRGTWKYLDKNVKVKIIDKNEDLIFSILDGEKHD